MTPTGLNSGTVAGPGPSDFECSMAEPAECFGVGSCSKGPHWVHLDTEAM